MGVADGRLILFAGGLLAAGLLASFLAARLRVPSLVLFLGVGMLVGSDDGDAAFSGNGPAGSAERDPRPLAGWRLVPVA